ncbi:IclR family transcriptional regulator [Halorussus salinisoli]|uniref:IclR family transcriptional regulator n=1 Tax=Halorussus salinisoli TaxID=2558242 RepID=UPI0010C240CD|nr:IclR family transcriptional regulator [Halorussus salinisoli]
MTKESGGREIKAVKKSCKILQTIKEREGATLSELTEEIDLSVGTIHTHLTTLENFGLVVEKDKGFALSYQFIIYGEHVRNHSRLYNAAKEEVDNVAEETGEIVHLMVEHNGREVSLYETWGDNAVATDYRTLMQEELEYLHCTASGKTILAHLPDSKVAKIIGDHGLTKMTDNTIVDREELLDNLEEVRDRGYALNYEEEVSGIRAVGVPIFKEEEILGSISISAPTARMQDSKFTEDYPQILKQAANIIEINIETSNSESQQLL